MSSDPDADLVRAVQDPDSDQSLQAFEQLYERHKDRVYSIAYRMTGSSADAMDVAQDAFCLMFRKIASFRFDAKFGTWLIRLTVNCCIDHKRREKSRSMTSLASLSTLEESHEPVDDSQQPQRFAEDGELGTHIQSSLQKLSPKLRAVLVLRYLEGMSYDELADTLEISLGTVKSRLARAHVAMERVLSGTLGAFGIPESGDDETSTA
jgi:RNA polymerase sigma-70 factor (ECF subfamily)